MGVTIHWRLQQKKEHVPAMLDEAQRVAKLIQKEQATKVDVEVEIRRRTPYCLAVDMDGCETLYLNFQSVKKITDAGKKGWDYAHATLTRDGKKELDVGYEIEKYPKNELYYASGFCKTQYAEKIVEHKWIADILKIVASRCIETEVYDEGDYYHSGKLDDAVDSIEENGKLINSISGQLAGLGYKKENIIVCGQTKIKSIKKTKQYEPK